MSQSTPYDLAVIGRKLLEKGHVAAAVVFLELSLSEYPESQYLYYTHYQLAVAHQKRGNLEPALASCRAAAEASPENPTISALLAELEEQAAKEGRL